VSVCRTVLYVLLLGALASAVAGCGSAVSGRTSETTTAARTTAPSACRTDQLEGALRFGPGSGSAGHLTGTLLLRDVSPVPCTLRGYPGVSFVDAHGRQLGIPAEREGPAGTTVALRPGEAAGALLTLVDVGVYPRSACRPARATGLRVYPPDQTAALDVAHPLRVCRGDERTATVGAMTRPGTLPPGAG
jgi:hypothetical protein